jgi:lysophospholipase L1-like esterase
MPCRIMILGDSSSSGIGLGHACYPAKLFRFLKDVADVEIINSAVPGFTSADASRFISAVESSRRFEYVIVYLGNNEAAVGGPKGYYSPFKTRLKSLLSKARPQQFRPILSPTPFVFDYQVQTPVIATTPAEFRGNIRSIIRRALALGAKVILINPVANERFPAGLGAANSSYFCYLDDLDQLGYVVNNAPIDGASEALTAGLKSFVSGKFREAIDLWRPFAERTDIAGFIAAHNIACARARNGDHAGESELRGLLGKYRAYDATILYNLAHMMRLRGDCQNAQRLLGLAYEDDTSVYRVKQAYRNVIAEFAALHDVHVLDLRPILQPDQFVDYCHPSEEGHDAIACALAAVIGTNRPAAGPLRHSRYELSLPSPNYINNPTDTFIDYYCIDWHIDPGRIAKSLTALVDGKASAADADDDIGKCLENFLRVNSRHPMFTHNMELRGSLAPRSHEILSFPEYFLYRLLYNYARAFEKCELEDRLSCGALLKHVRLPAVDYERIILRLSKDPLEMELDLSREYYDGVLAKSRQQLVSADQIYRVRVGERVRSTMTWYTREALRFGTQSRTSMLYARWEIEKLVESLVVAAVIACARDELQELTEVDRLLTDVLSLLQVHERHAGLYKGNLEAFSVAAYRADLAGVEKSIKARLPV